MGRSQLRDSNPSSAALVSRGNGASEDMISSNRRCASINDAERSTMNLICSTEPSASLNRRVRFSCSCARFNRVSFHPSTCRATKIPATTMTNSIMTVNQSWFLVASTSYRTIIVSAQADVLAFYPTSVSISFGAYFRSDQTGNRFGHAKLSKGSVAKIGSEQHSGNPGSAL